MTENIKASLSLKREEIQGTVDSGMPFGVPLIDQMDDEQLKRYLLGEITKATIGLAGSAFTSTEPVIANNLKEQRERARHSLVINVQ